MWMAVFADVGVAMGALGSDAAIEAADIVLMDDDPRKLALAIAIARKTLAIVRQNIVFSLVVKIGCLLLTALGYTNMWWAIFADVGVMVLAVLNAMRCLNIKHLCPKSTVLSPGDGAVFKQNKSVLYIVFPRKIRYTESGS